MSQYANVADCFRPSSLNTAISLKSKSMSSDFIISTEMSLATALFDSTCAGNLSLNEKTSDNDFNFSSVCC